MESIITDKGYQIQTHEFECPLDYQKPQQQKIRVVARSVCEQGISFEKKPWLVYLQGGPGFQSPGISQIPAWVHRAIKDYHILFLDQRGTGQSSPANIQTLSHLSPTEQAEYLTHFRADNIVRDAELIRDYMGIKTWSILGQSFGGFCCLNYLSFFPQSLSQVYITGGVPSLNRYPDAIYQQTYKAVRLKNQAFFQRFPKAQQLCRHIADHLLENEEYLPNGQRFTVKQFQLIGIKLGTSHHELALYDQLQNAFTTHIDHHGMPQAQLSYDFLNQMLQEQSTQTNPLYAVLHESIYCQGYASQWSAQRVYDKLDEFQYQSGRDFSFVGEMIYPWMFDELKNLIPFKEAANILAQKKDWPNLYDRHQLANNRVPISCAIYAEDMYVPMDFSRESLEQIPYSKAWITNEYEHDGLRQDGERILDKLIQMGKATQMILNQH